MRRRIGPRRSMANCMMKNRCPPASRPNTIAGDVPLRAPMCCCQLGEPAEPLEGGAVGRMLELLPFSFDPGEVGSRRESRFRPRFSDTVGADGLGPAGRSDRSGGLDGRIA